jgi:4-hydroxybenzoyl-CoA thioesterase
MMITSNDAIMHQVRCASRTAFAAKREGGGIRAVPIPPEIRRLCE